MRRAHAARVGFWALALAVGCATPAWRRAPHDRRFQSVPPSQLHEKPRPTRATDWWYAVEQTTVRPLGRNLSVIHWVDEVAGGPAALDVNAFGEVIDSPWFTNRIGRGGMTVEEVARGPNSFPRPADGPFRVLDGKLSGATPGLLVRDANGVDYLVKFDPPAYPGLASSAELITTKILHAAGYNVPENYGLRFAADRLVLEPGAIGPGRHGEPVALTEKGLRDLVTLANPTLGGEISALFSRIVEGEPIGPFEYEGRRHDDPNDVVPHDRRRSLRGYRWFSAWTNNTDTRASNTFDVFRRVEGDRGYVVHYFLDFGNALGSLGTKPKYQNDGYEPVLSWGRLFESFVSLGLRYPYWLPAQRSLFRSVGMFEAEVFDPGRWSPSIPNPAFAASDPLDEYWAAAIIARFDRDRVEAIVAQAAFRDPRAARYVVEALMGRREKIIRRAFRRVAPLDDPEVGDGEARFVDLEVAARLRPARQVAYRFVLREGDGGRILETGSGVEPRFRLEPGASRVAGANPFFTLEAIRVVDGEPGPKVRLHLRRVSGRLEAVGIERDVD